MVGFETGGRLSPFCTGVVQTCLEVPLKWRFNHSFTRIGFRTEDRTELSDLIPEVLLWPFLRMPSKNKYDSIKVAFSAWIL